MAQNCHREFLIRLFSKLHDATINHTKLELSIGQDLKMAAFYIFGSETLSLKDIRLFLLVDNVQYLENVHDIVS